MGYTQDAAEFESLIEASMLVSDSDLRASVLSQPLSTWDPERLWEWKQENVELFGDFLLRSIRSFHGGESVELFQLLLTNLHITIPQYDEDIAELCVSLSREFVLKQLRSVGLLIDDTLDCFREHPDFSSDREHMIKQLESLGSAVSTLAARDSDAVRPTTRE